MHLIIGYQNWKNENVIPILQYTLNLLIIIYYIRFRIQQFTEENESHKRIRLVLYVSYTNFSHIQPL